MSPALRLLDLTPSRGTASAPILSLLYLSPALRGLDAVPLLRGLVAALLAVAHASRWLIVDGARARRGAFRFGHVDNETILSERCRRQDDQRSHDPYTQR